MTRTQMNEAIIKIYTMDQEQLDDYRFKVSMSSADQKERNTLNRALDARQNRIFAQSEAICHPEEII